MTNICRIPDKTEKIDINAGEISFVDTKGLCCILKAADKTVYLIAKTSGDTDGGFALNAGESIELCGTFGVFAKESTHVCALYYTTL